MTDGKLAQQLAVNLDGSFDELVLSYQDAMYRFALRLTGCPHEAEELAQETFVRAYFWFKRSPDKITDGFQLRPWLYRVALNLVRNRARRSPPTAGGLDGEAAFLPSHEPGPGAQAEQRETEGELAAELRRLPLRYRQAVALRHIEQLSYDEIASALELPLGTVKSDVHRGLALLRAALQTHPSAGEMYGT